MKVERGTSISSNRQSVFDEEERERDGFISKLGFGKVSVRHEIGPLWLSINSRTLNAAETDTFEHLDPTECQLAWLLFRAHRHGGELTVRECIDFIFESIPEGKELPLSNSVEVSMSHLRKKVRALSKGALYVTPGTGDHKWILKELAVDGPREKKKRRSTAPALTVPSEVYADVAAE